MSNYFVELALAKVARNPDRLLPRPGLFELVDDTKLIDPGSDVGLDYQGSPPALVAFACP